MTMLALFLVMLLVGGGLALAGVFDGGANPGSDAVAADEARLPELGDATPVLASLSEEAPAPDPAVLTGELAPLLASPVLGAGVSASVVDVAEGTVLLDRDGAAPATPASTAKLLTA